MSATVARIAYRYGLLVVLVGLVRVLLGDASRDSASGTTR